MEDMQWTGQKQYNAAQLEDWTVDGELAGQFKTHGHLTVSYIADAFGSPIKQSTRARTTLADTPSHSSSRSTAPATWCPWTSPRTRPLSSRTGSRPALLASEKRGE